MQATQLQIIAKTFRQDISIAWCVPTMATLSYFDGFALVRILANTKSRESILIRLWDFEQLIGDWSWCLSDMFIYANMDQNDLYKQILE